MSYIKLICFDHDYQEWVKSECILVDNCGFFYFKQLLRMLWFWSTYVIIILKYWNYCSRFLYVKRTFSLDIYFFFSFFFFSFLSLFSLLPFYFCANKDYTIINIIVVWAVVMSFKGTLLDIMSSSHSFFFRKISFLMQSQDSVSISGTK